MDIKNYKLSTIEPEVGEVFTLNTITTKYKCIENVDSDGCSDFNEACDFIDGVCSFMLCSKGIRKDNKDVIFIRVKGE